MHFTSYIAACILAASAAAAPHGVDAGTPLSTRNTPYAPGTAIEHSDKRSRDSAEQELNDLAAQVSSQAAAAATASGPTSAAPPLPSQARRNADPNFWQDIMSKFHSWESQVQASKTSQGSGSPPTSSSAQPTMTPLATRDTNTARDAQQSSTIVGLPSGWNSESFSSLIQEIKAAEARASSSSSSQPRPSAASGITLASTATNTARDAQETPTIVGLPSGFNSGSWSSIIQAIKAAEAQAASSSSWRPRPTPAPATTSASSAKSVAEPTALA